MYKIKVTEHGIIRLLENDVVVHREETQNAAAMVTHINMLPMEEADRADLLLSLEMQLSWER